MMHKMIFTTAAVYDSILSPHAELRGEKIDLNQDKRSLSGLQPNKFGLNAVEARQGDAYDV
ncbi:Uncharacterised protein [uncultured archaeon]|nr:Uncharacterised protein [uncultured archaeon]